MSTLGGAEESIFSSSNLSNKNTFFNHVFSSTEEGKAEILNVVQYSILGIAPIVILNKLIQKFIPEADMDKSSLEILKQKIIPSFYQIKKDLHEDPQ